MRFARGLSNSIKPEVYLAKDLQFNCQNYSPLPYVIARGQGAYLWDVEGKRYLDCIGAYSAVNQGHLHPRIKRAMIEQLDRITITSRAMYNDQMSDAVEYLCSTFGYDKAIMMNTGVEGGETAIKFARRWGYRAKGIPKDQAHILFAKNNFWGRTIAACGSSDDPARYEDFGPFNLNFKILPFDDADAFELELQQNPNVAAIMLEPIQGEAGVNVPSPDFLPRIRKMCDKYNVLLILDEVQTGVGRTGSLLAQEHWGVRADLVILGKALSGGFMPISAVVGHKEIFDLIKPGDHGSTFGGNPLACRVMREAIQVVIDEKMCENSKKQGDFIMKELKSVLQPYSFARNLRGMGLFFAFDLDQKEGPSMKKFLADLASKGVLAKNTKSDRIRFAPPLIITDSESQFIVDTIAKSLRELTK